jgi:signal peptidase II
MTFMRSLRRPFPCGAFVAALTAAADWLSKYAVLYGMDLPARGNIPILPFFDLTMVWNRGISFGLLQSDGVLGRALLVLFTSLIAAVLVFWLWRSQRLLEAAALGAIIGGAVGNIHDRVVYGAVADFFDFHLMGWHWYVFNIADAAICIGAAMLLVSSFWPAEQSIKRTDKHEDR